MGTATEDHVLGMVTENFSVEGLDARKLTSPAPGTLPSN